MKPYVWSILSLCFILSGHSQNLPPIGAVWHYDALPSICICDGYYRMDAVKDTLWEGFTCRQLHVSYYEIPGTSSMEFNRYIREYANQIIYWDPNFSDWTILYDYSISPGQDWIYYVDYSGFDPDSIIYHCDSTDSVLTGGTMLKRIFFSTDEHITLGYPAGTILQRIGNTGGYFFPFPDWFDVFIPRGLRCYEDSLLGLYETTISYGCDSIMYLTGTNHPDESIAVSISPNPFSDVLHLEFPGPVSGFRIISPSGKVMVDAEQPKPAISLDTQHWPPGIYFVSGTGLSGNPFSRKLVKVKD